MQNFIHTIYILLVPSWNLEYCSSLIDISILPLYFSCHKTNPKLSLYSSTLLDHLPPYTLFVLVLHNMQYTDFRNHRQPWITRQKRGTYWHYLIRYWPLLSSTNTVTNHIYVNLSSFILSIYSEYCLLQLDYR